MAEQGQSVILDPHCIRPRHLFDFWDPDTPVLKRLSQYILYRPLVQRQTPTINMLCINKVLFILVIIIGAIAASSSASTDTYDECALVQDLVDAGASGKTTDLTVCFRYH